MYYSIDRFEGEFAVCEDEEGNFLDIPKALLPADVREGTVLNEKNGRYTIDQAEEKRRRDLANQLQASLWEKE